MSVRRLSFGAPLLAALVASPGVAPAQEGLAVPAVSVQSSRPTLGRHAGQTLNLRAGGLQIGLSVADVGGAIPRTRLFGDWYLTGPPAGRADAVGGLRLTSGLVVGPRHASAAAPLGHTGDGLRLGPTGIDEPAAGAGDSERVALPYVGVGYTWLSLREGWSFSADVGLGGLRPGERVRLGGSGPSAQQVQNLLNDLRLAPVLQFGVSYAF